MGVAIATGVAGAAASQDFDAVEIAVQDLGGGVHMLTGRGGNLAASVGPDGVFLVDDQFAPLTDKILAALRPLSDQPVRFVLNTHWHGDHTGGNENLGRAGALIVAHDEVRARMSVEQVMQAFGRVVPPAPEDALPVVTFDRSISFHVNGADVRAVHVAPAHTDGDVLVHFRGPNVLHTGDIFFNGTYPFIDLGTGGSIDGVIAAADRALEMANDATQIIPGHGPLSDRSALASYRAMLQTVRDAIAKQIAEGKDVAAVVASHPTQALDATWGNGFVKPDDFVEIVYQSLATP
jgi:glyoxylase-like metal-dependent hydrolase (beta-lactamase superfamily II)